MQRQAEAVIPTPWGNFNMIAYADSPSELMPHVALAHAEMNPAQPVLTRIHSECMTGDLFGSKRCDCGEQLERALLETAKAKGLVIYLRQEGRGIGLINKLKAYQLQDQGLNTLDANLHLGFEADARHYDTALQILEDLQITQIRLLTNNPQKLEAFDNSPVQLVERVPLLIQPQQNNQEYMDAKQQLMGHLFF
jgi:GTP cyclohydrolase II